MTLSMYSRAVISRGVLRIAGDPAADDDTHEVLLAREPLAGVVEPAGQLEAAKVGIHHHLDPVERRSGGRCGSGCVRCRR